MGTILATLYYLIQLDDCHSLLSFDEKLWVALRTKTIFFCDQFQLFTLLVCDAIGLFVAFSESQYAVLSLFAFIGGPLVLLNINLHVQISNPKNPLQFAEVIVINHYMLLLCQNPNQRHVNDLLSQNLLRYSNFLRREDVLPQNMMRYSYHLLRKDVDESFAMINYVLFTSKLDQHLPIPFDCQRIIPQYLFEGQIDSSLWFIKRKEILCLCKNALSQNEILWLKSFE